MFGWGKKDEHGKQTRLEHRGKHFRASRTGGVSARVEQRVGPVNATLNTQHGLRLSTRLARGARAGFQNGRAQFIGRWRSGPLAFNLSKSGASASIKNEMGSFNFLKPRYSSFKFGGVQVRGKNAAIAQLIFMSLTLIWLGCALVAKLAIWLVWFFGLVVIFLKDFIAGFWADAESSKGEREGAVDLLDESDEQDF